MPEQLNILVVRSPKLNTIFEVWSHQCHIQEDNHIPIFAGHTVSEAGQNASSFLGHLGTLSLRLTCTTKSFSARQLFMNIFVSVHFFSKSHRRYLLGISDDMTAYYVLLLRTVYLLVYNLAIFPCLSACMILQVIVISPLTPAHTWSVLYCITKIIYWFPSPPQLGLVKRANIILGHISIPGEVLMTRSGAATNVSWPAPCSWLSWWDRPWLTVPALTSLGSPCHSQHQGAAGLCCTWHILLCFVK